MNSCDVLVVDFLARYARFSGAQTAHLRAWWQATRTADEGLASFLMRQQLLSEPTVQIFHQVDRHHLTSALGFALLDRSEFEGLRRRLPEIAVPDELPATVTLLGAGDTLRETASDICPDPPRVGTMLGKYLLTDWVGQGASGVVFRALHPTLQIPVAVKVLHNASDADRDERHGRLKAEARLLARLNHPHIVRVFDFEQDVPHPFLVLEYVNGPSLAELIAHSGRVQAGQAVRMMRQLADALAAAHQLGIVHRDLKPANVLLTRDGNAKLADLGMATARPMGHAMESGLTAGNARVGTVLYMAPELVGTCRPADERSDLYSLGATFFHALTGTPPFHGATPWQVIAQHAKTPPPSPQSLAPELPRGLSELILRLLGKDPAKRPARFKDLLDEPALCLGGRDHDPASLAHWDEADAPSAGANPLWRLVKKLRRRMSEAEAFVV